MADSQRLFDAAAAKLRGDGGVRDLPAALELFRQAAGAGRVDAAVIYCNLLAAGIGGPRRWSEALRLLAALAEVNPRSRRELERIEAMALTDRGDPVRAAVGETLCEAPAVTRFEGLLTPEDCAWLAAEAEPMFEPAVVIDPATGRQHRDPVRV